MRYCFGDMVLDSHTYELWQGGRRVPLRPKVFHVLAYLLRHGDRIVAKQELAEQLWPGQFISDETLSTCITAARQAALPAVQLATILARAGGNPLFLEELAHAMAQPEGGQGLVQVPDRVQTVLSARIDRLAPAAKYVLQVAAVIGQEVPRTLLHPLVAYPEAVLEACLAQLQRAEMLLETPARAGTSYTFKHVLTQEAAYQSVLRGVRTTLHRRLLERLEAQEPATPDRQVEMLAQHAMGGEMWAQAVTYARQAGDNAMARSAYREAVAWYEQALTALAHLPQARETLELAIDLRLALRPALLPAEAFDHLLALLHEAETLAMALDDQRRLGRVCVFTASTFRETYDFDRARAYGQRALAIGTVLDDMTLQVLSRFYLGEVDFDLGDYPRAIDCFKRNIMALQGEWLYDHLGNLFLPACQNRLYLVRCLTYLGDFVEGMAVAAEAVQLAETVGRPFERVAAYTRTGYVHLLQGNFHQAISVLERGQVLVDDVGIAAYTFLWTYLAVAYARTGRTDKALHLLEEAVTRKARLNPLCVVETYLLAGRLADAHTVAQHRLEHLQRRKLRGFQVHALWLLGEIAMQREPADLESAAAHYRQALALANELGVRPFQAHCHHGLGKLYRHTGRLDLARAALSTAIDLYRSMAMTFWLPEAEAALAQVEGH